ncbi:MAG TPA: hypothetical protein VK914_11890 [bacterium]|nr:hypothetical protein [bacterium]
MKTRTRNLALLVLVALCVRLPVLAFSPGAPYDMESYARVAACNGPGLYASPMLDGRYPYLPLWWLLLKGLALAHWLFGGDPGLWFRLPGLAGDLALCILACLLAGRRWRGTHAVDSAAHEQAGLIAGLSWALNPLAVLASAAHGQFDSLALALLLGAAWLLEYSRNPRGDGLAALCLGAAVALKTWPVAFLPLYLAMFPSVRARLRFAAWVLVPPLLLLLPWLFMDGPQAVAAHLCYSGANGLGLSNALKACFFAAGAPPELWRQADFWFRAAALALLGLAFAWALLRRGGLRLLDGLPWAALTLILLAPGLSPQYLIWAPALALALSPALVWRLSLAALPLALAFYALFMPSVLAASMAWSPPSPSPALILAWGAANLAWWAWTLREWGGLKDRNLARPRAGYFS